MTTTMKSCPKASDARNMNMSKCRFHTPVSAARLLWAACLLASFECVASAQNSLDRVRRRNGIDSGRVTAISPLGVTISKSGVQTRIAVEEIRDVTYSGEPRALSSARQAAALGRYSSALESLNKISNNDSPSDNVRRDGVTSDVEFLKVLCAARLAIAGSGAISESIASVQQFLASHGRSYRVPAAIELLGDLHLANGNASAARMQYEKLAKAKTPYFAAKSALLVGRTYQSQSEHRQAIEEFDKALAADNGSPVMELMEFEAMLAKAVSQAGLGNVDQSASQIASFIRSAESDDKERLARAYNALGDCYLVGDRTQDALFAFLHVDLLYDSVGDAHAKSLHELAAVWKSAGYADRAKEAARKLAEDYPGSRWNRQ